MFAYCTVCVLFIWKWTKISKVWICVFAFSSTTVPFFSFLDGLEITSRWPRQHFVSSGWSREDAVTVLVCCTSWKGKDKNVPRIDSLKESEKRRSDKTRKDKNAASSKTNLPVWRSHPLYILWNKIGQFVFKWFVSASAFRDCELAQSCKCGSKCSAVHEIKMSV